MDTERLYEKNGELMEFDSRVAECAASPNGGYDVVLERTAFFPGGGGQECDTGTIGGERVLSIREDGGVIYHHTASPVGIGKTLRCAIDRDIRLSRMQNHSGEHIVSGIIHRKFGFENIGFHMGKDSVAIDFDGVLSDCDIRSVAIEANAAVRKNIPIGISFPSESELSGLVYRSKKELSGRVRIVTIDGIDVCACCAPHLATTGGIGYISILSHMPSKGGTRLFMLSGSDAVRDSMERLSALAEASALMSVKQREAALGVSRLKDDIAELHRAGAELRSALGEARLSAISSGRRNICVFEKLLDAKSAIHIAEEASKRCDGIAAVFYGGEDGSTRFAAVSEKLDMKKLASTLGEAFGGRCGGSKVMLQGSCSAKRDNIERFLEMFEG